MSSAELSVGAAMKVKFRPFRMTDERRDPQGATWKYSGPTRKSNYPGRDGREGSGIVREHIVITAVVKR